MSRPIKWRKICCMPLNKTFAPSGSKPQGKITMTIDEYETIRLMDLENCTQETCAMAMNVARTTVQKIYEEARYKLADALINGKELSIEGGEFRLCDGHNQNCPRFLPSIAARRTFAKQIIIYRRRIPCPNKTVNALILAVTKHPAKVATMLILQ